MQNKARCFWMGGLASIALAMSLSAQAYNDDPDYSETLPLRTSDLSNSPPVVLQVIPPPQHKRSVHTHKQSVTHARNHADVLIGQPAVRYANYKAQRQPNTNGYINSTMTYYLVHCFKCIARLLMSQI